MKTKIVKEKELETVLSKKKLHHFNNRFDIDYRRIYIDERRGSTLPPIIPIYLAKHAYALHL